MEKEKIYIVQSYGGEWEDKWEHIERAFKSKEEADKYAEEQTILAEKISDEKMYEIKNFLYDYEYEIEEKYFDDKRNLREGLTEDDYYKDCEIFNEETKYKLIKERFDIDKDDWDRKELYWEYDFCGFYVIETDLYC